MDNAGGGDGTEMEDGSKMDVAGDFRLVLE